MLSHSMDGTSPQPKTMQRLNSTVRALSSIRSIDLHNVMQNVQTLPGLYEGVLDLYAETLTGSTIWRLPVDRTLRDPLHIQGEDQRGG